LCAFIVRQFTGPHNRIVDRQACVVVD